MRVKSSQKQESPELKFGRDYLKYFYEYLLDKPNMLLSLPCGIINQYAVNKMFEYYMQLISEGASIDEAITLATSIPLMDAIFLQNFLKEARDYADGMKTLFMTSVMSIA